MCTHMHMASHNVAVQREVFEALRKEKRVGESFTALFARLLSQGGALEEVCGSWGKGPLSWELRELGRVRAARRRVP
jgi:predicted CopG family antitoxin